MMHGIGNVQCTMSLTYSDSGKLRVLRNVFIRVKCPWRVPSLSAVLIGSELPVALR
jgi:hypothetical protein